jgi:uncharacterized iron-regulated protein
MSGVKRFIPYAVTALLAATAVTCSAADVALRMRDRSSVGFEQMIDDIQGANFIFIGEIHDSARHHQLQLDIIRALHVREVPLAIALEMFNAESQQDLDDWVAGKMDEESFKRSFDRNWNLNWPLYRKIFVYARDNRIPLIGVNVPRAIVQKVARNGFASLSPEERRKLPPDITCNVDTAYMTFIRRAFAGHFGSERSFLHFCEAQMVWTKSMGRSLIARARAKPKEKVVVLTGVGHALKRGIPDELGGDTGLSFRVVLPEVPDFRTETMTSEEVDYLLPEQ